MSSTQTFLDDVFISYRHLDNQLLDDQGKGWIDNFHQRFETLLGEALGYQPKIWRDTRQPGNTYSAEGLQERIKNTAVMISILSPGYLQSDWCLGELREFLRLADQAGGLLVGNKMRHFKVFKTYVYRNKYPPELQNTLGYEFFAFDFDSERPVEFSQELGQNRDRKYWNKLTDLAWDVKQVLSEIKTQAVTPNTENTIYLAETTVDLRDARQKIKDELQQWGYYILPDKPLPLTRVDYEEAVREIIQRSRLSVHLVGSRYGAIPEGDNRSIVRLQIEIALERSSDPSFSSMVWLPAGLDTPEARQAEFIEDLKRRAWRGADLIQGSLEELPALIRMRATSSSDVPAPSQAEQTPQLPQEHEVFISHASEDLKIASLVRTALEGAGIGCWMAHDDILPSEVYSSAIIRAMNLSRLVLLVFTSNANASRHIQTEIDRAYNKEKPIILFRTEDIPLSESLEYYVSTRSWLIATEPPVDKHLSKLIVKVKQLCR